MGAAGDAGSVRLQAGRDGSTTWLTSVVSGSESDRSAADAPDIRPMIPLGQFRDTFIIAVDDEGVAIIDQHVAHERVLFERVMETADRGHARIAAAAGAAAHRAVAGRASGARRPRRRARTSRFRGRGVRRDDASRCRRCRRCSRPRTARRRCARSPRTSKDSTAAPHVQEALQRIAATTACHAAVKANYPLTYEKMTHILDELRATAYSTVCPHGRPVMLRLTRREIEKNFEIANLRASQLNAGSSQSWTWRSSTISGASLS